MLKDIIDFLGSLNKSKLKYLVLIVFIILLAYPFIDDIFIKKYIISQKIETAKEYSSLMQMEYKDELVNGYIDSIKNDIKIYLADKHYEYNPIKAIKSDFGKFIAGSVLWVIVIIGLLFSKQYRFVQKIPSLIFTAIILIISGYVSSIIPTILNPLVNYIGYNVLLLLLFYSFVPLKKEKA